MRIEVFPQDQAGCGHYRLIWPAEALAAQGHEVDVKRKRPQVVVDGGKIVRLAEPLKADVMVFQRPARREYVDFIKIVQSEGVKVVVDMDDDLSSIHYLNSAKLYY